MTTTPRPTDRRRATTPTRGPTSRRLADGSGATPRRPRRAERAGATLGPGERAAGQPPGTTARSRRAAERDAEADPVERLLALIRDELGRPTQRRLDGDRARSLVAGRRGRPRGRRRAARRSGRVGRLQPAVDRRPALRDGVLRADRRRCSPVTTCPTRGSSGPASTATASLASTPDRLITGDDLLRRSQEHTELLADDRRRRPPARACASGSGGASRPGGSTAGCSATCSTPASSARYLGGISPRRRGPRRGRRHLVHPRQGRPSCSRSSGRRCSASRCSAGTPGSRPTTRSSGSSSSPRSGPSWSATSSSARRSCATAIEAGNWHIIKSDPPPRVPRPRPARARRPRAVPRARSRRSSGAREQMPLFGG